MHKYKYFLIFFSGIIFLLIMYYFPISFDNNDDQAMYFINSGVLSGNPSPNIVHTNLIIGMLLKKLFLISDRINWYTFYLQTIQCAALLTIYYLMIYNNNINLVSSCLILFFLISGFSVLCIVKVQYTIVALICCATALLCIQSELSKKTRYLLALSFVILSILIRKDCIYIYIAFSIPVLFIMYINNELDKSQLLFLIATIILFFWLGFINNNNPAYIKNETYKYFKTLDNFDKPFNCTEAVLKSFSFTKDDIILISARYPASKDYNSGSAIIQLSQKVKTNRTKEQLKSVLIKFISDERYILLIYLLSVSAVLFLVPRLKYLVLLNGLIFLILLLYLASAIRIPHRVTFPLLIYVSLVNLYFFSKEDTKYNFKRIILTLFAILGLYKFYCTCKLIDMHIENHATFSAYCNEINKHPDYLFISLHDGFPVEFMNAWQKPKNLFPKNNLIMTGWNVWAPDFQNVLQQHQLKNITTDLKNKQNVIFLTNSQAYLQAFINVMKQRYHLNCHFENIQGDFKVLKAKKLIFDN